MAERRWVEFRNVGEIMADVDRLLAGHQTVGSWTLGQILNHLSLGTLYAVEGFPKRAPWVVRHTVGPIIWGRVARSGRMPEGIPAPKMLVPRTGLDARAEAEALRATIAEFGRRDPIPEHPIFGPFTRASWERLLCVHAAHHLSFVHPVEASEAETEAEPALAETQYDGDLAAGGET